MGAGLRFHGFMFDCIRDEAVYAITLYRVRKRSFQIATVLGNDILKIVQQFIRI